MQAPPFRNETLNPPSLSTRPFKIGVIHSSHTLAATIDRLRSETADDFELSPVGLEKAIPVGRQMQAQGVEVILSRKGTAHLLRENLSIPVISIPMSTLDILNALKEAVRVGRKVLLPSFRHRIGGLDFVPDLLNVSLMEGVYTDTASLKTLVADAKRERCQVVVGGGLAVAIARDYGLAGLEIETSEEAILTSLESARSAAGTNRKEREKAQKYKCIIDSVAEGVVTYDTEGTITIANDNACRYLKLSRTELEGQPVQHFFPHNPVAELLKSQAPVYADLQRVAQKLFVFNYIPVIMDQEMIGGVTTFSNTKDLERAENRIRRSYTRGMKAKYLLSDLKFRSPQMGRTIEKAQRFAGTDGTILITGETGTGKELLAQGVHNHSGRSRRPFVSLNCAALPEQLLESELFGYEEGAFTGSKKGGKPGLFEMAHRGTILLDEISATSQKVQSHLLRVIEEREVMRIGGSRLIPIDVRVIANSNLDLVEAAMTGQFREDLFFRLHVLPIRIPPLRDRREDITLLAEDFIGRTSRVHKVDAIVLPAEPLSLLENYSWPGNVRQLRHYIEQLVLLCNGHFDEAVFYDLYDELTRFYLKSQPQPAAPSRPDTTHLFETPPPETVEDAEPLNAKARLQRYSDREEKALIHQALAENRYNRGKTAQQLGICRATLWKKMKRYGL